MIGKCLEGHPYPLSYNWENILRRVKIHNPKQIHVGYTLSILAVYNKLHDYHKCLCVVPTRSIYTCYVKNR